MKRLGRSKAIGRKDAAKIAATLATVSGVALMWNFASPLMWSFDSQGALACGPFAKMAVFSHPTHPDYPFAKFAQGELGIIQPTFARSYLVVAYRYLTGIKTSPEGQKQFTALWNRRIAPVADGLTEAVKAWLAQRKLVTSLPFKVSEDYAWNNWKDGYINYSNRAFYSAADELKAKIAKYGANDNRVKDWVRAQDQVFAGASLEKDAPSTPPPLAELPATADKEQLADRAYQLASKDFYDGKFADAATKFQAIAKDSSSRWQKWGLYMAARSLCRKATTGESIDLGELENAQKLVDQILKSKELESMHANAQHLGHFIQYRLDPDSRVRELAKELVGAGDKVDFDEALGDYTCLLDHFFARPDPWDEPTPTTWRGGGNNEGKEIAGAKRSIKKDQELTKDLKLTKDQELIYLGGALAAVALAFAALIGRGTTGDGFKQGRLLSILALASIMLSVGTVSCSSSSPSNPPEKNPNAAANPNAPAQGDTQPTSLVAQAKIDLDDDMSIWVNNFIDKKASAADLAIEKWEKKKEVHWLLSAIAKLKATDARTANILKVAEKVGTDSPAYLTIAYHRARLAKEAGAGKDAVPVLKQALGLPSAKLPPSTRNLLLQQQLSLCSSLDEFAKTSAPSPTTISWDYDVADYPEPASDLAKAEKSGNYLVYPRCLTEDAADIINKQLPISAFEKLAVNPALPQNVRMNIAQAGWVRSVLLKNDKSAMTLLPVLATLNPPLKTGLDAYKNAAPADKEFMAVSLILHNPAMRPYVKDGLDRETPFNKIDNYRDNWWCDKAPDTNHGYGYVSAEEEGKPEPPGPDLAFLSAAEKKAGVDEYGALKKLGVAPNLLAKKAADYSKAHPKDAKLPEVLHLAVSATRYGCTNDETSAFSKQAFQELHKNFPGNPWTKKTKYFF